jgi:mRNA degradation ribonuclease J1/J2
VDFQKLHNWLTRYALPLYQVHASDHAKPHELKKIIADIRPRKAYLIHTDHPELYQRYLGGLGIETIIPQVGFEFAL